jgi:hypothetical protein
MSIITNHLQEAMDIKGNRTSIIMTQEAMDIKRSRTSIIMIQEAKAMAIKVMVELRD